MGMGKPGLANASQWSHSMSCWQHSFRRVSDCSGCKASVPRLPLTTSSPTNVPSMDLSLGSKCHSEVGSHKQDVPPFSTYTLLKSHTQATGTDLGSTNHHKIVGTFQVRVSGPQRSSTPNTLISKRGALDEDPFLCPRNQGETRAPGHRRKTEKLKKTAELRPWVQSGAIPWGLVCLHAFFQDSWRPHGQVCSKIMILPGFEINSWRDSDCCIFQTPL